MCIILLLFEQFLVENKTCLKMSAIICLTEDKIPLREKIQILSPFKTVRQGLATIFSGGPHCAFICVSRARFQSKWKISSLNFALCRPDVARGTYVALSCSWWYFHHQPTGAKGKCSSTQSLVQIMLLYFHQQN
jgi:hypothetical protein